MPTKKHSKSTVKRVEAQKKVVPEVTVDKVEFEPVTKKAPAPKAPKVELVKCVNCTEMLPIGTETCPNCMYQQ